jgi:hypothetical protein
MISLICGFFIGVTLGLLAIDISTWIDVYASR